MLSINEISFQNKELSFIFGIRINLSDHYYDLKILGTHQRIPCNFITIDFSQRVSEDGSYVDIVFSKAQNYLNFKLIISGSCISHDQLFINYYQPRNLNEITEFIKKKKIVFIGCARSCESTIRESIAVISKIGSLFSEYKIIVAENNSSDNTRKILEDICQTYPIELFAFDNLDAVMPYRTQRLSFCRNKLLDAAINSQYDYICVADLDGVFSESLQLSSFLSNWEFEECWDACFPINEGIYYDLWALRHPELMPEDFSIRMNRADYVLDQLNIMNVFVNPLQNIKFDLIKGWLEVDSAFGGMGIYKAHSLTNARYWGLDNRVETCEHVELHRKMKANNSAKLYINPRFIVKGI